MRVWVITNSVRRGMRRARGEFLLMTDADQSTPIWQIEKALPFLIAGFDVVIGSRSALFAPLPRLGLIAIDEEHEPAYKQESVPHYHARAAALELAVVAACESRPTWPRSCE